FTDSTMAIRMRLESKTGQAITEEIDPEDIEDCPYDLWALPADAKQNSHGWKLQAVALQRRG
ncbi:MAG: hypothetical protein J4N93_03475, partial [Chloroflexi bacterium]|nr:hypothetical protein [Chloroflexota bacterium]